MLTDEIKKYLELSVLCWLATVSEDGTPNLSPKEIFLPEGERFVLIAHIASPKSVRNIKANPQVCLSFLEIFEQKGYKLTGRAKVFEPGDPNYDQRVAPLKQLATERFPVLGFIEVEVLSAVPIVAPSYKLYRETTPEMQVKGAIETYNQRLETYNLKLGHEPS